MPAYFETIGVPLLAGREFTEMDTSNSSPVVMVGRAFARHYFGETDPIGRRIAPSPGSTLETIIGVVDDFEGGTPRAVGTTRLRTYYPYRDRESGRRLAIMTAVVRTRGNARAMTDVIRRELVAAEPDLPVLRIDTVEEQLNDVLAQDRLIAGLSTFFGAVAALLSCIGLYGIVSFTTSRRTSEMGVRMALGASPGAILRLVVGHASLPVLAGLLVGVAPLFFTTRLIASRLFGVAATDPMTILAACTLLLAVAVLASLLPALPAARVDPMVALRSE